MAQCEIQREKSSDRTTHEDRPIEFQNPRECDWDGAKEFALELVFVSPPFEPDRRQRFAVVGKIIRDESETRGDGAAFEQMTPLRAMTTRRVLEEQGNACSSF